MAFKYTTKLIATKVFSAKGGEIAKINGIGITLTVIAANFPVPNQGECYGISAPEAGYVREGEVKVETIDDIPPPPAETGRLVSVTIAEAGWETVTAVITQRKNV